MSTPMDTVRNWVMNSTTFTNMLHMSHAYFTSNVNEAHLWIYYALYSSSDMQDCMYDLSVFICLLKHFVCRTITGDSNFKKVSH